MSIHSELVYDFDVKKEKVLLVEDARDMQLIVRANVGNDCELTCASTLSDAESIVRREDLAMILLDVVLPDGSGFEFCQKLRAEDKTKRLRSFFLTGQNELDQKVLGFEIGGDDYITKPFEPTELKARILSKLKRTKLGGDKSYSRAASLRSTGPPREPRSSSRTARRPT